MFPNPPGGITITRVLSGVNKSLNIAKEIIPIYQTISPMIGNARKAFSLLKDLNIPSSNNKTVSSNIPTNKKTTNIISSNSNINLPSFFQ